MIKAKPTNTSGDGKRPNDARDHTEKWVVMFLRFGINTSDPRWSSRALEDCVAEILTAISGSIGEAFQTLLEMLGESRVELTEPVANFVRDFVRLVFAQYHSAYESFDWGDFAESLGQTSTPAQCYLALNSLPSGYMTPALADLILRKLVNTPYFPEAEAELDEMR